MTSKTALVFGWNGQDGSLISKSLLKKNYKVIGFSRNNLDDTNNCVSRDISKDIQIEKGDLKNYEIISKLIESNQPEEIYNLAAQSSVGKSFTNPITSIEGITNGTLNILEVARQLNYDGRIFFAGSSEIYGETRRGADINYKQNPCSPYGIAKQTSFNLVKLYRELYDINCVTGILFNHESPLRNKNFVTHKIISEAIQCSRNKSHNFKIGNLNISRDWGWAEEYVEAMQLINRAEKPKDHIICTGILTKLELFIETVFLKLDLNWKEHILSDPSLFRKKDIIQSYGNPSDLEKDLRWKAKVHINEIIEKLIEDKINKL
ncbi:GDP-mannose 4,6-dehydratase [Prochlorococcus marinus]|uniref:GDP-mannose 4,6-dehydratase n=1 Tax=Prochlorococcus marinus TaxID=1219 RepID=UPI0022B57D21|nr:GDP-mannose 4,6-dehydratase [Prochlorococcus marinus]